MVSSSRLQRIYDLLWRAATPCGATGAGPLERPRSDEPDVEFERRILADPAAALAQLSNRFSEAELIDAGAARRGPQGELVPAPALSGGQVGLVALRRERGEAPSELLTRCGCLRVTSLHALLDDYRLRARLREAYGYVYLALAWEDWLWLDALGLPALYCADLDELDASRFLRIHSRLKGYAGRRGRTAAAPADWFSAAAPIGPAASRPAATTKPAQADGPPAAPKNPSLQHAPPLSPTPSAEPQRAGAAPSHADDVRWGAAGRSPRRPPLHPAVVIMAWSPSTGCHDWPAGLETRLEGLAQAQQSLADRLPELLVWTPDAAAQAALSVAARCGDVLRLREAIVDSVEMSALVPAAACAAIRPAAYISARAAYRAALEREANGRTDPHELAACQEAYEGCLERELVEPLLKQGQTCTEPRQRAIRSIMAELLSQFLSRAQRGAAQLNRSGGRGSAAGATDQAAGLLREGLTLLKTLAAADKREK